MDKTIVSAVENYTNIENEIKALKKEQKKHEQVILYYAEEQGVRTFGSVTVEDYKSISVAKKEEAIAIIDGLRYKEKGWHKVLVIHVPTLLKVLKDSSEEIQNSFEPVLKETTKLKIKVVD